MRSLGVFDLADNGCLDSLLDPRKGKTMKSVYPWKPRCRDCEILEARLGRAGEHIAKLRTVLRQAHLLLRSDASNRFENAVSRIELVMLETEP